ncbi:thioredoxin domain-containing protein [Bacillus marinisedimentorum]|uniref:thioredoxin domain-containing protein n=1 Tax=Bacillus marinisedimentorum TaxID=1821260 RepID=UPI0007DEC9A5|nr:thioredoxin domain-containing protein [Bacillus marinisedimentorum]
MANRLQYEKSPYLLQHKDNPVDWYPWGEEAFEKARAEDKPVLVSIGYSTCHWCHVMAHESFEDGQVAQLLNDRFVSIKVDREERPDVDSIYMKVCQMLTGQGGWPLNVFLTPEGKPFYAGTYFPKESKYGRPGFVDAIVQLFDQYRQDSEKITKVSDDITKALNETAKTAGGEKLPFAAADEAFRNLGSTFDTDYGGFGSAPKFPTPHMLTFLLHYYRQTGKKFAFKFAEKTLDSMADGGIHDHIGGGFARYSTDEMWLVPHFEKMLYDNALLLHAYSTAYQLNKNPRYWKVASSIASFLRREMTDENGAFFSAIDADSEGVEGKYYIWSREEMKDVLGEGAGDLVCRVYGMTGEPDFEGKYIPNLIGRSLPEMAQQEGFSLREFGQALESANRELLNTREKRTYPHLDDKVLTAWNALAITALAHAGKAFGEDQYVQMAEKSFEFITGKLIQQGRIMARYRDGEVKHAGYIDDYAYFLEACLELYGATFNPDYLLRARKTADDMISLFWDEDGGGFYFTGTDSEKLISRQKEVYDGATPSGNSAAFTGLNRLSSLTGEPSYMDRAEDMRSAFKKEIETHPQGYTKFLQGLLMLGGSRKEIIVLGDSASEDYRNFLSELNKMYLPDVTILAANDGSELKEAAPFAANYKMQEGKTTVYVCRNFACDRPTTDLDRVLAGLKSEYGEAE